MSGTRTGCTSNVLFAYKQALTDQHPDLYRAMGQDRREHFITRLKWDIPGQTDPAVEFDQFDLDDTLYLVVARQTAQGLQHLGSCRARPIAAPSMTAYFEHLLTDRTVLHSPERNIWEVTRLCVSPALTSRESQPVAKQLISACGMIVEQHQIDTLVLIHNPVTGRLYQDWGLRPQVLIGDNHKPGDNHVQISTWDVPAADSPARETLWQRILRDSGLTRQRLESAFQCSRPSVDALRQLAGGSVDPATE